MVRTFEMRRPPSAAGRLRRLRHHVGGEQIGPDGKGKGGPELADVDRFLSYVDTVAPPFRATARRTSPDPEDFDTMHEEQKYLFDAQGYLVVPLLSRAEVAAMNAAVDANAHRGSGPGPRAAGLAGTPLEGAAHGAFVQYAGPCQWPAPGCLPFRELLVHPRLRPV